MGPKGAHSPFCLSQKGALALSGDAYHLYPQ